MWDLGRSTAWIVVGLCGWALLLTSLAIVLYARARHDDVPLRARFIGVPS